LTSLLNDPVQAEQLLAALGENADERFVTMVTGGHVDQIVNVARLGVLNLTVKRYLYVFKNVAQLVVFLTAVVLVAMVAVFLLWRAQQPAELSGDFNIAVAKFGEVDNDGKLRVTRDSAKISQALANYLDSEYSTTDFGLVVQVSHDRMPLVEEDRQAQKLAQAVNADLIIYGTVLGDDSSARLLPRFWVEPNPNLAEISGQSSLEAPIRYEPTKLADSDYLTETLRGNAAVLVLFTKALVSLRSGKLEVAAQSLDQALKEARGDFSGKEVLYLTGSTIARLQKDYDLALKHAETALELNPEYARAYVAMGNVYYDLVASEGDWSRDELLGQAAHWYDGALQATDGAAGAYIYEKASVSLGNVAVVQAQQHNDPTLFRQATDHYWRVAQRYEQSQDASYREDIREIAATAYFGLGAAYQRQNDPEQAIVHYQKCIDVTLDPKIRQRCADLLETLQAAG
jgi:tetratricopeptide (TPR) repeat protein